MVAVVLRGGDEAVTARVRAALEGTDYTIAEDGPVVIACSFEATAGVRQEMPRAAIVAIFPDTLEVGGAFGLRDAFDSVVPSSMVARDSLVQAIERAIAHREAHAKQILVDLASDGMALVSPTGITLYVNPAFERILGRPASEIVGRRANAFTHPEDIASAKPPRKGATSTRLTRALHKDGSYRWLESVTRDCTGDPNVGAFVVTFRDVTEHRAIERGALVTQRRLEYLLSSTRAVTYSCEPFGDFRCTFMSESVRDVLGWEAREFTGDSRFWLDHIHEDDRARVLGDVAHALAGGSGVLEYRFRHADGNFRWMQDELRMFSSADGGELIGYWIDVTAQREAAEKMRRSETNFRSLIESSPVATFVHRNRAIVYANHACAAMLGYERAEDLLGMDGMELVHPADRELVGGHNERTAAARPTTTTEIRLVRKDGSIVMVEGHGVLLDFDGIPSHVIMNRDVTERRMLFERAAAAERMRAVGAVAAGVAHEIKAPLGFVSNALALLSSRDDLGEEERRALVADATTGTQRMASIADSLRTMSNAREETLEHVDVALSMKLALKMIGPELGGITVAESYEDDLPRVRAQSNRLGQVFVNLLLNAAQAMREQPSGEIRISAARDGSRVVVRVSDSGPGIPPVVRDRIFEPFFTTKPSGKGTGLGLSISRSIVSSFGGELALEDTATGATFAIELPAAPAISKLRILLVDDDPAFVKTLRIMLESDHDVLGTTDAPEALAMITAGERFDAILCDMTMPVMTGLEFHERVGAVASDQARRIVFISGAADSGERVGHARLAKPFKPEELTSVLATLGQ
jgi:PAS domain S-box-containing protein